MDGFFAGGGFLGGWEQICPNYESFMDFSQSFTRNPVSPPLSAKEFGKSARSINGKHQCQSTIG